jgi:hypothetical protein
VRDETVANVATGAQHVLALQFVDGRPRNCSSIDTALEDESFWLVVCSTLTLSLHAGSFSLQRLVLPNCTQGSDSPDLQAEVLQRLAIDADLQADFVRGFVASVAACAVWYELPLGAATCLLRNLAPVNIRMFGVVLGCARPCLLRLFIPESL